MSGPYRTDLPGCTPEPLISYLKALGVFRIVSEQLCSSTRASWEGDSFLLYGSFDIERLLRFFLHEYCPTPVVAPWGGGSGFFPKDNKFAITAIRTSETPRLALFREAIAVVDRTLGDELVRKGKLDGSQKRELRQRLRSVLPDASILWLDAAFMTTGERQVFAPLLGTGGNDGRLDFSQNFMQRVCDVILAPDPSQNEHRLRLALLGSGGVGAREIPGQSGSRKRPQSPLLVSASVGQFDPGGVGGPNGVPGFEADSLVNPWDFVLMIEGTMLLTGAVARRLGSGSVTAAFPFTVSASASGWETVANGERVTARAELWMPLWQRPTSLAEIGYLLAEGRAQVGSRSARTGVDVARAVAGLGVDRGISAFQRYGFLQRSGLNFLAAPLGRMEVRGRDGVHLLTDVDQWLYQLQRVTLRADGPGRASRMLRQIEEAIFRYCRYGGAARLRMVLAALGQAQRQLSRSPDLQSLLSPLPRLSPRWLRACDDGSIELRLAAALASIDGAVGSIRRQLEPVALRNGYWRWVEPGPGVVWQGENLVRNLAAVLGRRHLEAQTIGVGNERIGSDVDSSTPNPELRSHLSVSLGDVRQFLYGNVNDRLLCDLFWALTAIDWWHCTPDDLPADGAADAYDLPRVFALLKLLYLTRPLQLQGMEPVRLVPDRAILARLAAGDVVQACSLAERRLRASGLRPLGSTSLGRRLSPDLILSSTAHSRLAAALLLPIRQQNAMARLVLHPVKPPQ